MAKRHILATDIVRDIRSGMTEAELLAKYQLSSAQLQNIIAKLVGANVRIRKSPRDKIEFPLPVYEEGNPGLEGTIRDISRSGVGVRGIDAAAGQIKILVIPADELVLIHRVGRIVFEAECRWAGRNANNRDCLGGFEIIQVYEGSFEILQEALRALNVPDRNLLAIQVKARNMDNYL